MSLSHMHGIAAGSGAPHINQLASIGRKPEKLGDPSPQPVDWEPYYCQLNMIVSIP